jgi:hypothetical protein
MPVFGFSISGGFVRLRPPRNECKGNPSPVIPNHPRKAAGLWGTPDVGALFSVLVLTLCLWGLSGTRALADKRVALIVGNSKYSRINSLVNPSNDAPDLARTLEGLGFEVILRVDIGKGEFDRSLAEFARKSEGADTALFYYAGHGLQYQRQNFLLPTDIEVRDSADVEFQAIGLDRVLQAISRTSGVKILILDACRDNPLAKQFVSRSVGDGGAARGLARIDRTEGLVIAYATAPDQVAQDGSGRNSPYTLALINRIREPGLEIGTMFRRVTNDVFEQTKGRQRPEVSISLLNDYFLNPVQNDRITWSRIRDSENLADFRGFIEKFPTSPFAQEAQFRIDLFERIRLQNEVRARLARQREQQSRDASADDAAARQAEADRREVERLARENRAARAAAFELEARKRLEAQSARQGLPASETQNQGK